MAAQSDMSETQSGPAGKRARQGRGGRARARSRAEAGETPSEGEFTARDEREQEEQAKGAVLLAALLDGMDAALCAFDAEGSVTHWNREAERILGWTPEEAVGRRGLGGWAVLGADADEVESRLLSAMHSPDRQVHEFALVTKGGGRVLVRTQSAGVRDADGVPAGVYCAFSEVHTQVDLERTLALSEVLLDDAPWGVVILDVDLRPAVVNLRAVRSLRMSRSALLGRPLGEVLRAGAEELEAAIQHVMADGPTAELADMWVTLRTSGSESGSGGVPHSRRCWRSGFLRLGSPLAEQPVPLGVAWIFQDVTESKLAEQRASRSRFRDAQLQRAARAAAECEDPREAAALQLDFALAGFADHAFVDLAYGRRLIRAARSPAPGGGHTAAVAAGAVPAPYDDRHPASQCLERGGTVRTSVGGAEVEGWAQHRSWPAETVHGMCVLLRSRGRDHGVVTFLRGASRRPFDRLDAQHAEDVAIRMASSLDLAAALDRARAAEERGLC
ncbi:PAS domain-containing protein [Streptomyces sp. XM4193]|uniref:PAS domain-containing protein n=1 Tax=Streptomyces sp. XM4193 TaxID=2929782 RepID=UPI001FF70763|nr:PAS domain-containing protein [Streptomyces sp. XM4193]MCK1796708.1 PAS domain-containing protein [Streptomyces sp. XM4193]